MATIEEIERLEQELGRVLPRNYRQFLSSQSSSVAKGKAAFDSDRAARPERRLHDDIDRLIQWNRSVRSLGKAWTKDGGPWPDEFLVIGENEREDYWALDATGDDGAVFLYDRDTGSFRRRWKSLAEFAEPAWVTRMLRLLPSPVLAIPVTAALFMLAAFCGLIGISMAVEGDFDGLAWGLCGLFATPGALIVCAGVARWRCRARCGASMSVDRAALEIVPTFTVFALLVSMYSWIVTGWIHAAALFGANPPAGVKHDVTLAMALASSLYTTVYGRRALRQYVASRNGRGMALTPRQTIGIVLFILATSAHLTWVLE
ncbi:MAG: SMI1/KNR4 family protein [Planctomycetales bacterium]